MIEFVLVFTLLLWFAYVATMNIVGDAKKKKDLNNIQRILVYLFVAFDVVHNFTAGSLLFLEAASSKRLTLSERLRWLLVKTDISSTDKYWRIPIAKFMCKYMIEPWDFGHCTMLK